MMSHHGHEGESLGAVRVRERKTEGRQSLSGLICWAMEIWVLDLRGKPVLCFLLLIFACDIRQEILSVYLDCDCAVGLWAHGFLSDG